MGATVSGLLTLVMGGREKGQDTKDSYMLFTREVTLAVEEGNLDRLSALQAQGVSRLWGGVDTVVSKPPLLHRAAARGHTLILKYLLDHGANAEATDTSGMTVLHQTCMTQHAVPSCFHLVVGQVQDIDKRDAWGRTPLIKAMVYRNTSIALTLLEMGANPNAVDMYGMTPLSTAVNYNMIDMVRALVVHGGDINFMSQHFYHYIGPPLYLAINNQNEAMVSELLRLGASTQPRPQDYVCSRGLLPWRQASSSVEGHLPILQHPNAVTMAMAELLKQGQEHIDTAGKAMAILMTMLAAHGHNLGPSTDVLVRVLNTQSQDFSLLRHKFQICSPSCEDDLLLAPNSNRDSVSRPPARSQHFHQLDHHLNNNNNNITTPTASSSGQKLTHLVTSLETQARREVRRSIMGSGRNVVWAANRLQCPPRLKSLILLRDIDMLHGTPSCKLVAEL